MSHSLWCPAAMLESGWRSDVAIAVSDDGWIEHVEGNVPRGEREALAGPVIPGLPNLHSHAHQRAMAGLAERASGGSDSFWTWRDAMYRYASMIEPEQLAVIARQLYVEMLKSGYTSVAEFQYLHHPRDGGTYDNPAELTLQCMQAATDTGIGFTALPVFYRFAGFGEQPALPEQTRFINDTESYLRIFENIAIAAAGRDDMAAGIAPHSLRAASIKLIKEILSGASDRATVVHIHIAEQRREVEECVANTGARPVERLFDTIDIDRRWCLVHATHMSDAETARLAASGAVAGLCPTTEASLGDGLFNAPEYLAAGGHFGIGSDSQISVSPVEELRWLEYGMRLSRGARNVLASGSDEHTGQRLLRAALAGGAQACGRPVGAIAPRKRADFIVLDGDHPRLHARQNESLADSLIFSGNENLVRDVYVGGRRVIADGHHRLEEQIAADYRRVLDQLNSRG